MLLQAAKQINGLIEEKNIYEWLGDLGFFQMGSSAAASPLFFRSWPHGTWGARQDCRILCLQRIAVLLGDLRLMARDRIAPREIGRTRI